MSEVAAARLELARPLELLAAAVVAAAKGP